MLIALLNDDVESLLVEMLMAAAIIKGLVLDHCGVVRVCVDSSGHLLQSAGKAPVSETTKVSLSGLIQLNQVSHSPVCENVRKG